MTKAILTYSATEIEAYIVTFRGNKSSTEVAIIFEKYRNIEILETCEIDVIKIEVIYGEMLEEIKRKLNNRSQ